MRFLLKKLTQEFHSYKVNCNVKVTTNSCREDCELFLNKVKKLKTTVILEVTVD